MTALTIAHISVSKKEMAPLYGPSANWRNGEEYPPLKPDSQLEAQDFLRLAWEVLRRAPRYRWHFERLKQSGLLDKDFFGGEIYHFSAHAPRRFEKVLWSKINAYDHFCVPAATEGQTLVEYMRENEDSNWQVMHGTRWVKALWGVSTIIDPITDAERIDLEAFFAPSLPQLANPSAYQLEDSDGSFNRCEVPWEVNADLTFQDVLFTLRLDVPFEAQIQLLKRTFKAAQKYAGHEEVNEGARMTDAGLSSVWLRAWDARQEIEKKSRVDPSKDSKGKIQKTQFPRSELLHRLQTEASRLPKKLLAIEQLVKQSGRIETFGDKIHHTLVIERIDKWIQRSKRYIELDSYFYRRAIAASLEYLDYVHFGPRTTLRPPSGTEPSVRT